MDTPYSTERIEVAPGVFVAVDRWGRSGEPVLLLHGIPGSRYTWRHVTPRLASRCHVIVPDLLGFGDSSDPPGDFHASGQASALLAMLDTLGIGAAHIVGFDFGGPIALTLYRLAPARCRSLTLAATNTFTDTPLPGPLVLARVPIAGELLFHGLCSWPGLASLWIGAVADKRALPWRAFAAGIPGRRSRRWTRQVFLDSLRYLCDRYAAVEATLPAVRCPCAVLWGDSDRFFSIATGERTAASIPKASLQVLPGCGHFIPEERPEALVSAVVKQIDLQRLEHV